MPRLPRRLTAALAPALLLAGVAAIGRAPPPRPAHLPEPIVTGDTVLCGSLADGATYLIEVPAHWNRTLFLYSHGYVTPGSANPAQDVGDPVTGGWLLRPRLRAGRLLLRDHRLGDPAGAAGPDRHPGHVRHAGRHAGHTIAWGHSLGGIITAGLIQRYPSRFSAALPMCGVLAGGVATWNTALDAAFAFQQLVDPSVRSWTSPTRAAT